jgi:outer membrane protein TolC
MIATGTTDLSVMPCFKTIRALPRLLCIANSASWATVVAITLLASAMFALPLKSTSAAQTQGLFRTLPEQRVIQVRSPEELTRASLPDAPLPFTVSSTEDNRGQQKISLDEAIQIAIQNAEVIRVLGGVTAVSSGRTIYNVALANTGVDLQTAVFDPQLNVTSTMNKTDQPGATFDPANPGESIITGSSTDSINTTVNLTKQTFNGATAGINANWVGSYFEPGIFPLEPQYRSGVEMSLRQPLMRGYGRSVNLAPVVIARIDTERSYFQFKDSVQELVRGVINAYWNLVAARIDVWARQQQVEQAEFAFNRAKSRKRTGLSAAADVAQASSALANFKAGLISARSSELLSETALRNILGLSPSDTSRLVPTSAPVLEKVDFDWNEIVSLAEQYRPDIIELKLVLESDRISLMQANNQALPQFDGIANYRWDGLSGEMPNGLLLRSEGGRFAGFNLGVNFSVPLGLRQGRASLRRRELLLAQDQANLDQQVHQMVHQLTINYRNLDQFFEQYLANKEASEAALLSFEVQNTAAQTGSREFINVLQAITDWGNAISQEARSISQYNTELANVERQTGTILETHGIRFVEEQYGSLGPRGLLGIRKSNCSYPASTRPDGGTDRYEEAADTSDDAFNLKDLDFKRESKKQRQDKRPVDAKPKTEDLKPRLETEDLPSLRPPTRIETPRPDTGTDLPGSNGKPINDASAELGALEATPNSSNRVARKNRIFNWLR